MRTYKGRVVYERPLHHFTLNDVLRVGLAHYSVDVPKIVVLRLMALIFQLTWDLSFQARGVLESSAAVFWEFTRQIFGLLKDLALNCFNVSLYFFNEDEMKRHNAMYQNQIDDLRDYIKQLEQRAKPITV